MYKNKKFFIIIYSVLNIMMINNDSYAEIISINGCDRDSVQKAVNESSDGDVVMLGAGTCSWNSPVKIEGKGITIRGAGIDITNIVDLTDDNWGNSPFWIEGEVGHPFRISGFTFKSGSDANGIIYIRGNAKNWRVDNCKFYENRGRSIAIHGFTYGLIDGCQFIQSADATHQSILIYGDNENSWDQKISLGSSNAVFVEDCVFKYKYNNDGAVDAGNGGNYVFRYNIVENTLVGHHGLCSTGYNCRSTYTYEIYNNQFKSQINNYRAMYFRGGTGVVYNNSIEGYSNGIMVSNYRSCMGEGIPYDLCGKFELDRCDGDSEYDGNIDSTGYPCLDQIGRAADADGDGIQDPAPLYEWNNTINGADLDIIVANPSECSNPSMFDHIKSNRDYYNDTVPDGYTAFEYPHPIVSGQKIPSAPVIYLEK